MGVANTCVLWCYLFMLKIVLLIFLIGAFPAQADDFQNWLRQFQIAAAEVGISQPTLDALYNVEYQERVIELDRSQPESKLTLEEYLEKTVTASRIEQGRDLLGEHYGLLSRISHTYGVPPAVIVALWGKETNYGQFTGGFFILDALATLAYEGRRAAYFKGELLNALRIIDSGAISANEMKGSWAGAMGQCQFMPTSYFKYAADGDGDGKADIWNSLPDVFSSAANYLHTEGWNPNESWGMEVRLSQSLPESVMGYDIEKPMTEWAQLGVTGVMGGNLPNSTSLASLVQPDGAGMPAYLVFENFRVLRHWNKSTYFGVGVGTLADAIGR